MATKEELVKILIKNNKINIEQGQKLLETAEKEHKKIDDLLIEKRYIKDEELTKIKAGLYKLPYINLLDKEIDNKVLNFISGDVAENYKIVCFEKDEKKIKVGLTDPNNFKALEAVDYLAKENKFVVEYYIISKKSLKSALGNYKSISDELSTALESRAEEDSEVMTIDEKDKSELAEVTKSAPVAKIVSVIIRHAVEGGASDIHIEPLRNESRVRYRIDGILHTSLVLPHSVHNAVVARIKVMADMKLDETRSPQDGRIRMVIAEKTIDFRVSTLPLVGTEKVVMRILDTTRGAPKLEELGFQGSQLKAIRESVKKTEGLILMTGPTGSGKSTTIFSLIDILNKEEVNISTLEDPVEYQMKGVSQSQIKPEIGYTFASGLRSFLRQDPDIIMVGEIRDTETGELAIHAALTGHLVLSTLHTTSAPGAITRLVDMDIEPFLLGSTLIASVAQRLARKICAHCIIEEEASPEFIASVNKVIESVGLDYAKTLIKDFDPKKPRFHKGKGCGRCGNTGYAGRIAIAEVLVVNEEVKKMVISGTKSMSAKEVKATQKFITVKEDGILKVLQGLTTVEDVLRVMKD